jgi:hypothetical protein
MHSPVLNNLRHDTDGYLFRRYRADGEARGYNYSFNNGFREPFLFKRAEKDRPFSLAAEQPDICC